MYLGSPLFMVKSNDVPFTGEHVVSQLSRLGARSSMHTYWSRVLVGSYHPPPLQALEASQITVGSDVAVTSRYTL